jgi:hypothetical protein
MTARRAILLTTTFALGACQQLSNLTGSGTVAGKETGTAGRSAGATVTAQRTDHDMSQVISALAALGAQPIESLSVERARRQPSPADAVRRGPDPRPRLRTGARRDRRATDRLLARRRLGDRRPRHPRRLSPPLQAETGAVVLSFHHRQGPENRLPAAHDDTVAGHR